MRFFTLVALMAATASVSARAIPRSADVKALNARFGSLEVRTADVAPAANADQELAAKKKGKKGKKGKKSKKSKKSKSSASSALSTGNNNVNNNNNNSSSSSVVNNNNNNSSSSSVVNNNNNSNSSSIDLNNNNNNSSSSSTSDDSSSSSSSNNTASSTSTANSATRTRPCDQGDQSLAAGLQAAVVIGIGQQASVATIQATNNSADFQTAVTRLQQFTDTMGLQLQMAQGIADDDSFAQKQLKLLAASQTSQETAVKALTGSAQQNVQALNDLLNSFQASTDNAQDGAEQALIDCFLPVNAVSG